MYIVSNADTQCEESTTQAILLMFLAPCMELATSNCESVVAAGASENQCVKTPPLWMFKSNYLSLWGIFHVPWNWHQTERSNRYLPSLRKGR